MRVDEVRTGLAKRLRARRVEIVDAALTRIYAVSSPGDVSDPEYVDGLKVAVSAALDYGIEALQRGDDRTSPIPTVLLSQARLAARHRVTLDTVLRRYLAGHTLLCDFIVEEWEGSGGLSSGSLKLELRSQAIVLDRLLGAVSEEYAREIQARPGSAEDRRIERIERLLAGELLDPSGLTYDFAGYHLGIVGWGAGAADAMRELAAGMDREILLVARGDHSVWAWLGGRRPLDFEQLERAVPSDWAPGRTFAIGEAGSGLGGWRLTHHQAQAAMPIARRRSGPITRYADVALLASIVQDDLLVTSLREIYLAPLEEERDGGRIARATLRAYFDAERQVSSTAAHLGVNRNTVAKRLSGIEETLGRPLGSCLSELDAALRLEELVELAP